MKKMKKILALVIGMMMIMGITAMAATISKTEGVSGDASITVTMPDGFTSLKDAADTYTIYKVFDATIGSNNAISYTLASGHTTVPSGSSFKVDTAGNVSHEGETISAADLTAIADYVTDADKVATVTVTEEDASFTVSGLPYGYYYIDTTTGALVILNSTTPNASVQDKNDIPTIKKEVKEDSDSKWYKNNDADLGQTVEYRATITVKDGAKNYVVHDTMTNLTFSGVTSVTLNDATVDAKNYVVDPASGGSSFTVDFTDDFEKTLKKNDVIIVYYSGVVNSDAIIAGEGNPNEVYLTFGDNNETVHDTVKTFVWKIDVEKYETGNTSQKLAGAQFVLSTSEDEADALVLTTVTEHKAYKYERATTGNPTVIETDDTGTFEITGLDAGTYYLIETDAPDGYNKLTAPVTIVISSETYNATTASTLSYKVNNSEPATIGVGNAKGATLPSTGGIGTTIFYVIGAILVLGAGVLLVTRKRMGTK